MPPAPAVAAVRRAVRACLRAVGGPVERYGCVLVACSGGADSLALAAAAAFEAPRAGVPAGLITVDHGLQPDSAETAARVAAFGYELGLDPVLQVRVDVGTDGGQEAAARAARYTALDAAAASLDAAVLLGHTLDDQAETVLLGLGRGSGPRSIAGMREVDGRYLRPLLRLRRAETCAACAALGLQPWDDPHNVDPRYQRVRLRREVLPLLDEVLQGGVAPALARTADLVHEDLDALDGWAAAVLVDERDDLDAARLADLPRAVRTRVLRSWLAAAGAGPLTAERTAVLDSLLTDWHGQGPVDVPGGLAVVRRSGRLVVQPSPRAQPQVTPGES
jgi:tRNA(Ile)-lysidine synthase